MKINNFSLQSKNMTCANDFIVKRIVELGSLVKKRKHFLADNCAVSSL